MFTDYQVGWIVVGRGILSQVSRFQPIAWAAFRHIAISGPSIGHQLLRRNQSDDLRGVEQSLFSSRKFCRSGTCNVAVSPCGSAFVLSLP